MATSFRIGSYYGSAPGKYPAPPGYSHRAYREAVQRGELPGHKLPGRGGYVVSVEEWDQWVRSRSAEVADPIAADIKRRFRCAS